MKTTKINIGLAISRNYDKVTLLMLEEPIEHDSTEEFSAEIRKRYKILREEIALEFEQIQND